MRSGTAKWIAFFRRNTWWAFLVPALASAWTRGLWAPDEPRYAQVAREMFERGDFLVMHLCGDLYPDKPPLLFWLAGLFGSLSDWSVPCMRLVSIAAVATTAYFTSDLARRWWGAAEARWAPVVFLSFVMVLEIGGRLQIDPLLTAACTGAIWFLDSARGRSTLRPLALVGGLLGLAALAKGPVAFVDVGLVALAWRLVVDRARPHRPLGHTLLVVALAGLPVLVWALAAAAREPTLFGELFYGQHLDRVLEPGERHPGPPWKNLLRMPLLLMPWTPAVLAGLAQLRRRPGPTRDSARDEGLLRAALWLGVLFLFFSIIPPKRDLYLLPAYPAAALLAARWLGSLSRARRGAWSARIGAATLAVFALATAALPWLEIDGVSGAVVGWAVLPGSLAFAAGAGCVLRRLRSGEPWHPALAGAWALGITLTVGALYPHVDPHKSSRALAQLVAELPQEPERLPCVGVRPEGYRFYGGLPAVPALELRTALDREGRDFLALVTAPAYEALPEEVRGRTRTVMRRTVGSRDVLVLGVALDGLAAAP